MIHVFTSSPRAERTAKLAAALADLQRDGESLMEIRPAGVSRLEPLAHQRRKDGVTNFVADNHPNVRIRAVEAA